MTYDYLNKTNYRGLYKITDPRFTKSENYEISKDFILKKSPTNCNDIVYSGRFYDKRNDIEYKECSKFLSFYSEDVEVQVLEPITSSNEGISVCIFDHTKKDAALSVLFVLFFGPIGLIYSSVKTFFIYVLILTLIAMFTLVLIAAGHYQDGIIFGIFLSIFTWFSSLFSAYDSANNYNKKIKSLLKSFK